MVKPNPWPSFVLTFLLLILGGTFALELPGTFKGNLAFIDALFTATSAVCVTGLIVTNTSNFTLLGQIIVLSLIQLGGLGIMILSTSFYLFIRGEMDVKKRIEITKIIDLFGMDEAEYVLKHIIAFTFICEAMGAFMLFFGFLAEGLSLSQSIYLGIFHAISAFCNAGFSVFDDSLIGMNWFVKCVIMLLIVAGGIGFYVVYDLHMYIKNKSKIKIHSKIVITITLGLILSGAMIFFLVEPGLKIVDAFFQSITARTAGFNSVDISKMTNISKFVLILLMIIGASPGGTGGGVKTSTFGVAFLSTLKILKGESRLMIFKREIPRVQILRAFSLIFAYGVILLTATLVMLNFYDLNLMDVLFEVASALGTVGLSVGVSMNTGTVGKLVLILCMFVGRIGPSALVASLAGYEKKIVLSLPEEKVILG